MRSSAITSQFGVSIPDFWMGILLIGLFASTLHWLPTSGYRPLFDDPGGWLRHIILPGLTVGLVAAAIMTRYIRSAVLEVAAMGYVRTARSKGLSPRVVTMRHTVRNAAIPVLTITGIQLATILGGVIVVEVVFAWPGLGRLVYNAVAARDYPVIQGAVLLIAALVPAHQPHRGPAVRVGRPEDSAVMTMSTPPTDTAPVEEATPTLGLRLLAGNPVTVASAIVLAVLVFVAVTAQWIAPFGINDIDVPNALRPARRRTLVRHRRTRPRCLLPSAGGRAGFDAGCRGECRVRRRGRRDDRRGSGLPGRLARHGRDAGRRRDVRISGAAARARGRGDPRARSDHDDPGDRHRVHADLCPRRPCEHPERPRGTVRSGVTHDGHRPPVHAGCGTSCPTSPGR